MATKTYVVRLSDDERTALTKIAESKRTAPLQKQRAQILLLSDESLPHGTETKLTDVEIAERVGCYPLTVRKTRKRANERGVFASLKRKVNELKNLKPKASGPEVQVPESAEEISWEEQERRFSQQIDQLAKKENLTQEVEEAKANTVLKVKNVLALFETATGLSQPDGRPSFADLDLELAHMGEPTPMELLYFKGLPGKIVEPLIESLLSLVASPKSEDFATTLGTSKIVALNDEYQQKLEKARKRAKAARLKMLERSREHIDVGDWSRYADTLEDYFQVIDEIYEDIFEAGQWILERKGNYVAELATTAQPLITELVSTQFARDAAHNKSANQAAEIERMRRSGFVTPPYNVTRFSDAYNLSPSTIKDLIAAYVDLHKGSDFPSRFINKRTRKKDQGGYITDSRDDALRFSQFLWEHVQGKSQTTKPKAASESR